MKLKMISIALAFAALAFLPAQEAKTAETTTYWMKIRANDKVERTLVANTGVSIEAVIDGYVIATGNLEEKNRVEQLGRMEVSFPLDLSTEDFPSQDAEYHNMAELKQALIDLNQKYPQVTKLFIAGKSTEGRDILGIRISGDLQNAKEKPAVIFMG